MVKYAFLCGGSAIAVAASLYGTQAVAATAAAADTAAGAATVGELVVVAEKREQKIETVPVAITAYSAEQRKLMGIEIVQDLANFTPSLVWTDINDRIYIRGIGRNSDNLNNTSGVAIYYNGLYYGANASVELQKDDLFIGNIEVDAGPQNTLHGSNSDGGVVNFISQRPTDSYYAEGRFGFQNLSEEFIEGVVSGPIDDHLKFRFGGNFTIQRGGNFLNYDGPPQGGGLVLGGGGNTEYLEFQLQGHWDHFDTWTMVSSGNFAANSKGTDALGNIPTNLLLNGGLVPSGFYGLCAIPGVAAANAAGCASGPPVTSVTTLPVTANQFPGNNPGNVNPRSFIQEFNSINNQQRNIQVSEDATWHAPDFDLQYLGSYQQFHYILEFPTATDAGVTSFGVAGLTPVLAPAPNLPTLACLGAGFSLGGCASPLTVNPAPNFTLFNEYDQSFSHEINIISTWANPLQYVAGLYWWHEHWNQPVDAGVEPNQPQMGHPDFNNLLAPSCAATGPLAAFAVCAAPANPSFAASTENTEINYNSYAAYGQVSYKFNDKWKVSGALRYTDDDKKGWQSWRLVVFDGGVLGSLFSSSSYGANTPAFDITSLATAASLGHAFPGAGPASIQASSRLRRPHATPEQRRVDGRGGHRLDAGSEPARLRQVQPGLQVGRLVDLYAGRQSGDAARVRRCVRGRRQEVDWRLHDQRHHLLLQLLQRADAADDSGPHHEAAHPRAVQHPAGARLRLRAFRQLAADGRPHLQPHLFVPERHDRQFALRRGYGRPAGHHARRKRSTRRWWLLRQRRRPGGREVSWRRRARHQGRGRPVGDAKQDLVQHSVYLPFRARKSDVVGHSGLEGRHLLRRVQPALQLRP